jgi:sulfide:quinone oxidoreductase
MTAAWADEHERQLTISLVTPELRPLAIFGVTASAAVSQLLREAGIELQTATVAERIADGRLRIAGQPSRAIDLAVAVPALEGPALEGLPHDPLGFVPVDRLGRVEGVEDVYAAGDVTNHRIKQGGLAAEQAEAAASAIAANAGAPVLPHPYEPVLRAALLTGDRPRYLRRTPSRASSTSALRDYPLWWPDHKIAGRRLAVHLARHHDRELRTWTDEDQPFRRAP